MDKKDIMLKEIDIIQSIITRMWTNSFLIKWWTLTLVVWIIALDKFNDSNWIWLLAVIMATIITFWRLDSYFYNKKDYIENYINGLLKIGANLMNIFLIWILKDYLDKKIVDCIHFFQKPYDQYTHYLL